MSHEQKRAAVEGWRAFAEGGAKADDERRARLRMPAPAHRQGTGEDAAPVKVVPQGILIDLG